MKNVFLWISQTNKKSGFAYSATYSLQTKGEIFNALLAASPGFPGALGASLQMFNAFSAASQSAPWQLQCSLGLSPRASSGILGHPGNWQCNTAKHSNYTKQSKSKAMQSKARHSKAKLKQSKAMQSKSTQSNAKNRNSKQGRETTPNRGRAGFFLHVCTKTMNP